MGPRRTHGVFFLGIRYKSLRSSAKDRHRRDARAVDIHQLRAIGRPLWRQALREAYRVTATYLSDHDARPARLSRRVREHLAVRRERGSDLDARIVGELPGSGNSSPVVWNGRLFVQSSNADGSERMLFCLDTKDGSVKWVKSTVSNPTWVAIGTRNGGEVISADAY